MRNLKYYNIHITLKVIFLTIIIQSCHLFDKNNDTAGAQTVQLYQLPAPAKLNPEYIKQVENISESWYQAVLKRSGFNGGIIVAKNGNVVFERYNGVTHLGKKDSVNANTSLHIASASKTFTAMVILKLWQDKLIGLDDAFAKYFPGFNYPGVTIRILLNHRSGLPNYVYFMDELGWNKKKMVSNADILNALINRKSELRNITSPNKHFTYCNTNFALLALLIEKITKQSYPEYLKKVIFDPLQMKNTFVYTPSDSLKANPSYNWKGQQEAFMNLDNVYGDKNIFSTPQDLLKWDRLLATKEFLSEKTLQEAFKPYSNERSGIRNYGLGWRMYNFPSGYKIIYHNGWWHGSNAVFIRLPKEDATIIVIGNKYNRNIYKAKELIGLFVKNFDNSSEEE